MSDFLTRQLNREIEAFQTRIPTIESPEQAAKMQRVLDSLIQQRQQLRTGFQYPRPKAMAELQPT